MAFLGRIRAPIERSLERVIPVRLPSTRPRITLSLTTTPHRIDKIRPTLEGLENQTLRPDQIILSIPHTFERDGSTYVIPDWLRSREAVLLHRTQDRGPATKLLGALEVEQDPETIIITVDDDTLYPEFLVRRLVKRCLRDPASVFTVCGGEIEADDAGNVREDSIWGVNAVCEDRKQVTVLEGFGGTAYRRRFFGDDIHDFPGICRECYLGDDLTLSFYLARRRVPIRIARDLLLRKPWSWQLDFGKEADALHGGSDHEGPSLNSLNYRECLKRLREICPDTRFPAVP